MEKNEKQYEGLTELEVIALINKKEKKYAAMFLDDLEEEGLDTDKYKKIRKSFLDTINAYTRGVCRIIGINLEGADE